MKVYCKNLCFVAPHIHHTISISYLELSFFQTQRREKYNLGILQATVEEIGGISFPNNQWRKKRMGSPKWIFRLDESERAWYNGIYCQSNIFIYYKDEIDEMINSIIGHGYELKGKKIIDSYTVPLGCEREMWNYILRVICRRTVENIAYEMDCNGLVERKHFCLQIERPILLPHPDFRVFFKGHTRFDFPNVVEFLSHTHPYVLSSEESQNLPVIFSP